MARTRFQARWDSVPSPQSLVGPEEMQRGRQVLADALNPALSDLRADFGGMTDYYELPARLQQWAMAAEGGGWDTTARTLGALDLFFARRPASSCRDASTWCRYLRTRLQSALTTSCGRLVQWRSILHAIPEQWLPEELLRRSLQQQISADGRFTLLSLDLALRLPTPGGKQWLSAATRREWPLIRARLAQGRPCAVELVRERPVPDLLARETVVVFSGDEPAPDTLQLRCYHPAHDGEIILHCDFTGARLVVAEIGVRPDSAPVCGFFLLDYRPESPPAGSWSRLLRLTGFPRLAWWWRHRRRKSRTA